MDKHSLAPFLLIKVLFASLVFLVLGSAASVLSDSHSRSQDIYTTGSEVERIQTEIMSKENCFPDCVSKFSLDERWLGLQSRLAYYEKVQEQSFLEQLRNDIQVNDIWYALVSLLFLCSLFYIWIKSFFVRKVAI